MPVYTICEDANHNKLERGDTVRHDNGFAIVIETRGARATIQFADNTRLWSRGIDLIKF